MLCQRYFFLVGVCIALSPPGELQAQGEHREVLWAAIRTGDVKAVTAALDKGADVTAKNEIGITALWMAASKGDLPIVELLLKRGADVNARDAIWYQTPLSSAVSSGQVDMVKVLLKAGAKDVDAALLVAAGQGRLPILRTILEHGKVKQETLDAARTARPTDKGDIVEALDKAGAKKLKAVSAEQRDAWKPFAGTYESDNGGKMTFVVADAGLAIRGALGPAQYLKHLDKDRFTNYGVGDSEFVFERKDNIVSRVVLKRFTAEYSFYRVEDKPVAKPTPPVIDVGEGRAVAPLNWPAFRGLDASGIADGQHLPLTWDVKKETNVRWKTAIPGMGHSCPVVWGNRVFLTTAISGDPNPKVRTGNYGDVDSVNDTSKHTWQVLCLDRDSGAILWKKTVFEGVPKFKRHLKGSQANCTPVTDGKRLVACFGSEGMYCFDFDGKQLWKRDLGTLDSSFAIVQQYEWGFGSSLVLHDNLVILQADLSKDSFLAAYSLEDGARVWFTPRDEIPSWSSPMIWRNSKRVELVTNAAQYARSYDPATGKELWRLAKKSEITVPTPVANRELLFITSGNRPIQPIFAVRPGASGDISLKEGQTKSEHIAWSTLRGGPYMPTPILYGQYFYTCGNAGMLTCYEADTGKQVYRERLGGDSYTASPVASDGRLYFVTEQGEVRVARAGRQFELLAVNDMGDVCMATPAVSNGTLFVRSQHFLYALGRKAAR